MGHTSDTWNLQGINDDIIVIYWETSQQLGELN